MRSIPLNSIALEALKSLKGTATVEYVFCKKDGSPYRSIRSAFRRACQRAKLSGVTPHTLRHTFASRLVMAGVDLRTVQELGGWQTIAMVERYSHLSPQHKLKAVERLAQFPSGPPAATADGTA
jgi:site-specific recombinase XerD